MPYSVILEEGVWDFNINNVFWQKYEQIFIFNTSPLMCLHRECKITHTQNDNLVAAEVSL